MRRLRHRPGHGDGSRGRNHNERRRCQDGSRVILSVVISHPAGYNGTHNRGNPSGRFENKLSDNSRRNSCCAQPAADLQRVVQFDAILAERLERSRYHRR